jgi:carboxymethylenebutenolidase
MKKQILLIFLCMLTAVSTYAQKTVSCCQMGATNAFARLASNEEFVASHAAPLPYTYVGKAGKMITFPTADGTTASAFELKSAKNSNKYLFVFQEWWGLNDYIKKESEKYFNQLGDVTVLALDMYDGKIATAPDQAGQYMQAAKPERLNAIIEGAFKYVGKNAKVATIGWCFGGAQSLNAALLGGKQTVGCVMYYGMPEKDVNRLKTLNSDVLGIFAAREEWISPKVVSEFDENMKKAGKKVTVKSYDAVHAFANPSNPNYDKAATEEAYKLSTDYLKSRLK